MALNSAPHGQQQQSHPNIHQNTAIMAPPVIHHNNDLHVQLHIVCYCLLFIDNGQNHQIGLSTTQISLRG